MFNLLAASFFIIIGLKKYVRLREITLVRLRDFVSLILSQNAERTYKLRLYRINFRIVF